MLEQTNAALYDDSSGLLTVGGLAETPGRADGRVLQPVHIGDDHGDRTEFRPDHDLYVQVVKPVFDRTVALIALAVTAPVMAIAAITIRFTMGAGVIFVQTRVGKDGQPFRMYKFRTMRPDRRQRAVAVRVERRRTHKHPNDPRLTSVGRFLRKWSLDELPQFVNVLLGHMSLVGPRPEMVDIVDRYERWQHGRHVVKPGLTGLWQISDRGGLLMHECVERDIEYVTQLSWRTDLSILLRTPAAMLGSRRGF